MRRRDLGNGCSYRLEIWYVNASSPGYKFYRVAEPVRRPLRACADEISETGGARDLKFGMCVYLAPGTNCIARGNPGNAG